MSPETGLPETKAADTPRFAAEIKAEFRAVEDPGFAQTGASDDWYFQVLEDEEKEEAAAFSALSSLPDVEVEPSGAVLTGREKLTLGLLGLEEPALETPEETGLGY